MHVTIHTCWWKWLRTSYKQYLLLLAYFPISTEGCTFCVSLGRACVPATMHLACLHICRSFQPHFVLQHRHPLNHPVRTQCIFLCTFSCMTHVTKQHTYFRGKIDGTAVTGYYTNLPPFCIALGITVRLGK